LHQRDQAADQEHEDDHEKRGHRVDTSHLHMNTR
jgi:hypothetical protein